MGDPEPVEISRITIVRYIAVDGEIVDDVTAVDSDGDGIALTDALGMMRLAEDTLIRTSMGRNG